jgi:hypothetical protein
MVFGINTDVSRFMDEFRKRMPDAAYAEIPNDLGGVTISIEEVTTELLEVQHEIIFNREGSRVSDETWAIQAGEVLIHFKDGNIIGGAYYEGQESE